MGDGHEIGQVAEDGHWDGASNTAPRREREPRTNLFLAAVLQWSSQSAPVTIRNMSTGGALVEAASLPPSGSLVRIVRGTLVASGTVAWCEARRCGIKLADQVAVALWMAKPGNSRQAEIDEAVRRIKAGGALHASETPTAPAMAAVVPEGSLADRVRELEGLLLSVSDDLANDPATVVRHFNELQKLDLLAQGLARLRS